MALQYLPRKETNRLLAGFSRLWPNGSHIALRLPSLAAFLAILHLKYTISVVQFRTFQRVGSFAWRRRANVRPVQRARLESFQSRDILVVGPSIGTLFSTEVTFTSSDQSDSTSHLSPFTLFVAGLGAFLGRFLKRR